MTTYFFTLTQSKKNSAGTLLIRAYLDRFFLSMFFLLITLTQLISKLKVGLIIICLKSLLLILMLTIAKELVDD
jgi:hypothetical protein